MIAARARWVLAALVLASSCRQGAGTKPATASRAVRADSAAGAVVAPSAGAAATSLASAKSGGRATGDTALYARADRARIQGREGAPIWVIEISDFQCPFCRQWHDSTYEQLRREYVESGKIRFAYINFPLPMHKNAFVASEAAMCAAAQDKFWAMHSALFDTQDAWGKLADPRSTFDSLAGRIGANRAQMKICLDTHQMRELVQADFARSEEAGVRSTPSFMIGSVGLAGAYPFSHFKQIIDSLLAAAGSATPAAPARKP
jgi:protein-disulfide isomerase